MLRRLFALVVLVALGGAALYLWRDQPHGLDAAGAEKLAAERLGHVGQDLSDAKTTASVKTAFGLNRDLKATGISVSTERGVVFLRGDVTTMEQRDTAEAIARAVPGVESVKNELKVDPSRASAPAGDGRTIGESLDDRALEAKIELAFSLNRALEGSDLDVRAWRREVTLVGEATSSAQKDLALQLARAIPDVSKVVDQVRIRGGAPSRGAASGRAARVAEVERALATNPNLAPYGIRAREEGGHIVLSGRVTSGAEKDLAGLVARDAAQGTVENGLEIRRETP